MEFQDGFPTALGTQCIHDIFTKREILLLTVYQATRVIRGDYALMKICGFNIEASITQTFYQASLLRFKRCAISLRGSFPMSISIPSYWQISYVARASWRDVWRYEIDSWAPILGGEKPGIGRIRNNRKWMAPSAPRGDKMNLRFPRTRYLSIGLLKSSSLMSLPFAEMCATPSSSFYSEYKISRVT